MPARHVLSVTAVLGLGLLGACSSTAGSGTTTGAAPAPAAVQRQAVSQPAVKLVAMDVEGLGPVLTDANGRTLYLFAKDTTSPPKSTCDGACATAWPPLMASGSIDVQGVDAKLVGTVTRTDGGQQVTVNGWPVYLYAKDTAAGEAKGQDVGGTWSAIIPAGRKAVSAQKPTAINTTNIPGQDRVLTDQNGMTLYLFTKDGRKPPKSTCEGQCATTWPPLLRQGSGGVHTTTSSPSSAAPSIAAGSGGY